jgi:[acyl-carrier-protein] S-malonyltransferase
MVAIIGLDVATVTLICEEATAKSGEPISIANYLVDGNYAVSGTSIFSYEACMSTRL